MNDVGSILLFVSPGFFARAAYNARFPQPKQADLYTTVVSVATSVPIVVVGRAIAHRWTKTPQATDWRYVLVLIGLGIVAGHLFAAVRGSTSARRVLRRLRIPFSPEATVYEQTILKLPLDSEVTVTFRDGRIVSGFPTIGPGLDEESVPRELYLSSPRWWRDDKWVGDDAWRGLIINLGDVVAVTLDYDPMDPNNDPSPTASLREMMARWRAPKAERLAEGRPAQPGVPPSES